MVVVGSWSKTERIYPLYNITRLDGLRQMRADYKKFDTTWEKRSKKNSVWPAKKFFFSIKISDMQQKGAKISHFPEQIIILPPKLYENLGKFYHLIGENTQFYKHNIEKLDLKMLLYSSKKFSI